jgi:hypothetical protein
MQVLEEFKVIRNITDDKFLEMKNTLREMLMKLIADQEIDCPNEVSIYQIYK